MEVWEGASESSWLSWDYYSDEVSIQGLEYLVKAFGNRYKEEPAVFAWDLTNEPFVKWSDGPMKIKAQGGDLSDDQQFYLEAWEHKLSEYKPDERSKKGLLPICGRGTFLQ